MPLFMDIHIIPGVKARDVAEAHRQDMLLQHEHHCQCMTYWIDEKRENVFCLIEAPDKDAVITLHSKAHGLVPHKIIEVNRDLVESFLGRIYDPPGAGVSEEGLKIFHDPSFRFILFASTKDAALLRHEMGIEKANAMLNACTLLIRQHLAAFDGREVEHPGAQFIASFTAASSAVSCALAIQQAVQQAGLQQAFLRIGINAGEPVSANNSLFGDTIQLARQLCFIANDTRIAIASVVKEIAAKDYPSYQENTIRHLPPADELVLQLLFNKLEKNWQDSDFTVREFCQEMSMSQSQLYRKTVELTNLSPNSLLKAFRLEKARDLMKKKRYSISQITFDAGFTSPSYFTKCFKKSYGLLPMDYVDLLH